MDHVPAEVVDGQAGPVRYRDGVPGGGEVEPGPGGDRGGPGRVGGVLEELARAAGGEHDAARRERAGRAHQRVEVADAAAAPVLDDETDDLINQLRLSGITRVEGKILKVRNRIYESVFDGSWVRAIQKKRAAPLTGKR